MENQIEYDNKLIADYLGWKQVPSQLKIGSDSNEQVWSHEKGWISELQFHSNWDDLMLAVDKIEREIYDYLMSIKDSHEFRYETQWGKFQWSNYKPFWSAISVEVQNGLLIHISHCVDTRIESVWLTIIDYIKWKKENEI